MARRKAQAPPAEVSLEDAIRAVQAGAEKEDALMAQFRAKRVASLKGRYISSILRAKSNAEVDVGYHDAMLGTFLNANDPSRARVHAKAHERAAETIARSDERVRIYSGNTVSGDANKVRALYRALGEFISSDSERMRLAYEFGRKSGTIQQRVNAALKSLT